MNYNIKIHSLKYYLTITFESTLATLNAFRECPYFLKTNAETARITIDKFLSFLSSLTIIPFTVS